MAHLLRQLLVLLSRAVVDQQQRFGPARAPVDDLCEDVGRRSVGIVDHGIAECGLLWVGYPRVGATKGFESEPCLAQAGRADESRSVSGAFREGPPQLMQF